MTLNPFKLGALMIASALFGAVTLGGLSGFQANTAPKFATVDVGKVFDGSSLAVANTETLEKARVARATTLDFVAHNIVMDPKDAKRYADLATKATPLTPTEAAEMAKLKSSAEDSTRKQREMSTKAATALTDDDKKAMDGYGNNAQGIRAMLPQMQEAYSNELQNMQGDLREKTLDRVQEVIRKVGASKGYSVVFSTSAAPYAANDLTKEATDALKK